MQKTVLSDLLLLVHTTVSKIAEDFYFSFCPSASSPERERHTLRQLVPGEKTGANPEIKDGGQRRTRGGEMLPTLAVGWRATAGRGEEAGRFREVGGVSIVAAVGPHSL